MFYFCSLAVSPISHLPLSVKSAATESGDVETLLQIVLAAATAINSVTCLGASSVSELCKETI